MVYCSSFVRILSVFIALTTSAGADPFGENVPVGESLVIELTNSFSEVEVSDTSVVTAIKLSDRHVLVSASGQGEAVMYLLSSDGQLVDSQILSVNQPGKIDVQVVETQLAR